MCAVQVLKQGSACVCSAGAKVVQCRCVCRAVQVCVQCSAVLKWCSAGVEVVQCNASGIYGTYGTYMWDCV